MASQESAELSKFLSSWFTSVPEYRLLVGQEVTGWAGVRAQA